jgi:hypothetical protein
VPAALDGLTNSLHLIEHRRQPKQISRELRAVMLEDSVLRKHH